MFGIAITGQKPPAAAAVVPVSMFSLYSWPGRAQVHVRVDERREQVLAGCLDCRRPAGRRQRSRRPQLGDLAVADQDVARLVDPGARVEHVRLADQQLGRPAPARWNSLLVRRAHAYATACSTGAPTSSS